jgi:competence protein ComGC
MKNNLFKAFSLAELMMLLLILSIILAATMPVISKRAKYKAAQAGGSTITCMKVVNSSLSTNLSSNIKSLSYTMYGGNNGGGSSTIVYNGNTFSAAGGATGSNGQMVLGTLLNLTMGKSLVVSAGSGGGSVTLIYTITASSCPSW